MSPGIPRPQPGKASQSRPAKPSQNQPNPAKAKASQAATSQQHKRNLTFPGPRHRRTKSIANFLPRREERTPDAPGLPNGVMAEELFPRGGTTATEAPTPSKRGADADDRSCPHHHSPSHRRAVSPVVSFSLDSLFSTHKPSERSTKKPKSGGSAKKGDSNDANPARTAGGRDITSAPGVGDALIPSPKKGVPPRMILPSFKSFTRGVLTLGVVRSTDACCAPSSCPPRASRDNARGAPRSSRFAGSERL